MAEQEKKEVVTVKCEPNGTRCNICGCFIPEGDFMCGNGHEPGKSYSVFRKAGKFSRN